MRVSLLSNHNIYFKYGYLIDMSIFGLSTCFCAWPSPVWNCCLCCTVSCKMNKIMNEVWCHWSSLYEWIFLCKMKDDQCLTSWSASYYMTTLQLQSVYAFSKTNSTLSHSESKITIKFSRIELLCINTWYNYKQKWTVFVISILYRSICLVLLFIT